MILFEEAYKLTMDNAVINLAERVSLAEAMNRVLAEDVRSLISMPPFNKSAVDGFACRKEDIGHPLQVVETIAAGQIPKKYIGSGQCSRIMTGAMVPGGADCVLMVENCSETAPDRILYTRTHTADNICYLAEDIKAGQMVMEKGTLLNPGKIAVLASAGCHQPLVYRRPSLAVISTGDELIEPGEEMLPARIFNSNAMQLMAQAQAINVIPHYMGIARDHKETTLEMIQHAMQQNDVILLSGGVSMGDFDFVPQMMQKAGFEIVYRTIAIQPGKPTVFGIHDGKYCFGLPGNPVSSFVLFELLVKPFLYRLMGHSFKPIKLRLPFGKAYQRKKSERLSVLPVKITEENTIVSIDYHGSAHIHAMSVADGLVMIPVGTTILDEGEITDVRLI